MRINCDEKIKFKIVSDIQEVMRKQDKEFNDIDGIRADNENGWWLIRASNTSSCLVARCEASSQDKLDLLIKEVNHYLKPYNLSCI